MASAKPIYYATKYYAYFACNRARLVTFSNVITLSLLPGLEIKSEYDNMAVGKVPVAQPETH